MQKNKSRRKNKRVRKEKQRERSRRCQMRQSKKVCMAAEHVPLFGPPITVQDDGLSQRIQAMLHGENF